ncbi:MAG: enoyl-[acyl-carrier-protein] reductase FabL [bacterium]
MFSGKKALITGGSRGIGRACAIHLAEHGADVAINYLRNVSAAEETAEQVRSRGSQALLLKYNVGKVENIQEMFSELKEKWGGLDIFISNAVLGVLRPADVFPEKGWEMTVDINAKAYLFCAQEAVKLMEGRRRGHIVALSSIGSIRCMPGYSVIGASKAAIETLTRYLALELAPRNINVNCVSGGPIDTDALRAFPNYEELIAETASKTPLGRMGTPEDLANVVVWLCSDESSWVTGQTIIADGGLTLM